MKEPKKHLTEEILATKVTKINKMWHVRLVNVKTLQVLDEMACDNRINIGYCCYYMLRIASKLGWESKMADSSRMRQHHKQFRGKIWYPSHFK